MPNNDYNKSRENKDGKEKSSFGAVSWIAVITLIGIAVRMIAKIYIGAQ